MIRNNNNKDFWRITEDWSNDVENSALHYRNKLHLKYITIEIVILFHNITVFTLF